MKAKKSKSIRGFTIWGIGGVLLMVSVMGCQENKRSAAEKIVKEWMGKEILFPADVDCWYMGKDTLCPQHGDARYKMLVYTDSAGCTGCKLNLPLWKLYMEEMDSIAPGQVDFAFYFQPKDEKELAHLLRRDRFEQIVFIDQADALKKSNRFPEEMEYQCFLLDHENRVLAIGNPTLNPQLWDIYKTTITSNK